MASTSHSPTERTARLCAEAARFMRDHVLSRVSHDLRSPLNAIHSWAYVLERKIDSADAAAQRALAGIRTGVEQQVHLLETLVDTTRAETRKLAIERAPFAFGPLVDEALNDARTALGDARGVSYTVQGVPADAAAGFEADRERLAQSLWLMLVFAAETSAQGAQIALNVSATATAAQFEVQWTASPQTLTDDALPHALEAFARAQAAEPQEAGRAAWVLSLCQRVAEAHGGRFEAQPLVAGEAATLTLSVSANGG